MAVWQDQSFVEQRSLCYSTGKLGLKGTEDRFCDDGNPCVQVERQGVEKDEITCTKSRQITRFSYYFACNL